MHVRWSSVLAVLVLSLLAVSCGSGGAAPRNEILVSAAISLKDAFLNIGSEYEKKTGFRVRFNFGASGLLQKQIESGAPVDVFASAGERQMNALQSAGFILQATRRNFTRNVLVLAVPVESAAPIRSFADLAGPRVTRIAIGNPKTVPAGQYGEEALRSLGIWEKVQSRLVFAENARQVLDYITQGEVDAGLVYASDAAESRGARIAATASQRSYSPIYYPVAVIRGTADRARAGEFIDLVLSGTGQAILRKHGFPGLQ